MNEYNCKICNYETKDRSNLNRHLKSIKHSLNVTNSANISNINSVPYIIPNQVNATTPRRTTTAPKINKSIYACDNKKIICDFCGTLFTRTSSLSRHKKSCTNKKQNEQNLKDEIKLLNQKLQQYEKDAIHKDKETKHYKKETHHYKEEMNYYKQMLMEAGG